MRKLAHAALVTAVALTLTAGAASAAPFAPLPLAAAGPDGSLEAGFDGGLDGGAAPAIVPVRGGCGFGEHRGPFGGCRINHGPRGRLRAAVTGLPGGCPPGLRRGFYGRCRY